MTRRDSILRRAMLVLAALGLLDALYLSWLKLSGQEAACAGIGDCDVVNSSPYAEFMGIPVAVLGAGVYVLILLLLWVEPRLPRPRRAQALYAVFGLVFFGVAYSAYLTYIEVAVLHAICPFCVFSALVLLFLWVLAIIRVLSAPWENPEAIPPSGGG